MSVLEIIVGSHRREVQNNLPKYTVFRSNQKSWSWSDAEEILRHFFSSSGERDTGGDPCEAAGQSEVEPVWEILLQVKFDVSLWSKIHGPCTCPVLFHSVLSPPVVLGCCCFCICCTSGFSHYVVYFVPWRTLRRTTHSQTWTKPSGSRKHSMCVGVNDVIFYCSVTT